MTNKELLEAARNWKPTEDDLKRMREKLKEINWEQEQTAKRMQPTQEWLNKSFSSL